MKKILHFLLFFSIGFLALNSSAQVNVGTGTLVNQALPIEPFYGYTYSQSIYLSSEMNSSGSITGVKFYTNPGTTLAVSDDWVVYIGHTTKTSFSGNTDWETGLTQKFAGLINIVANEVTITFTTPFVYNGSDNLIVAVDENKPGYDGSTNDFLCTGGFTAVRALSFRSDSNNPDPAGTLPSATFTQQAIPNIQFIGISQACPNPLLLTASNITSNSADLGWSQNGTPSTWNIEYGAPGFVQGSGNFQNGVTTNPYTLTNLASDTDFEYYVQADCGAGVTSSWIGPLSFSTFPTCVEPNSLAIANVSGNVEFSWFEQGTATIWNIEYGLNGFAPTGTPTIAGVTNNPETVTGLAAVTGYDFYVQSDCGGGDESSWVGPITVFTLIVPVNCTSGTNSFILDAELDNGIPNNMTNTATGNPQWIAGSGGTSSTGTGPSNAFSGSGYLYLETSGGATGDSDTLKGTADLTTGLNSAQMNFYYHMYGTAMGELKVEVSSDAGLTWTTEFSQIGQVQTSLGDPWTPTQIDLTPYLGLTLEYRIIGIRGTSYTSDMAIDLLRIETCVSCPNPTDLNAVNITPNDADLSWIQTGPATTWNIEYGITGFPIGSGTPVPSVTSNPYTLTNLGSSTVYDFYVQADCGQGDQSIWFGPFTFTTQCDIELAPYFEGFETGVMPLCWDNLSSDPTNINTFWRFGNGVQNGALANGRPAGTYAWSDGNIPNPDSMMLVSPPIDLGQLTSPYVSFEWFSNNTNFPLDNHPMILEVYDGTSWTLLDTLLTDSVDWMFVNYDLGAFMNDTIQIRFMINQTLTVNNPFYSDILIDNFNVNDCFIPGGQDGMFDVCRFDSTVNLEGNIISKPTGGGEWSFPGQPSYLIDDTIFNVQFLPTGAYDVFYVERFVCYDTTFATINVFGPSSAGTDGTVQVCKNEPINLYGVIGGSVDLGGVWYDFTNLALPNSQPRAEPIPGSYNYTYIVTNGVCPADTSIVEVTVLPTCDFLSIGEEEFTDITVYPNPTMNILNIVNPSNTSSLKLEMLDMNGRVVLVENKALSNATEAVIAIDHLERGIYTLRLYNTSGQKTFKIVKQ